MLNKLCFYSYEPWKRVHKKVLTYFNTFDTLISVRYFKEVVKRKQ